MAEISGTRLVILRLIADGKADKEISGVTHLTRRGITYNVKVLMDQLQATSRTRHELVAKGFRAGILH